MPSVVRLSSAAWLFGVVVRLIAWSALAVLVYLVVCIELSCSDTQALIASISSFLVSFYHTAAGLIPSVARARQIKTLLDTLEDPTSLLPALHFPRFPAVHFNYAALPFISSPPRSPTPPTPSASLIICACVAAVLFMSATFWIPIIIPASIPMLPLAKPTASIELAASPAEELPAPPLKPATPLAENLPAEPVEETAEPALLPAVVIEAPATRIRAKSADGRLLRVPTSPRPAGAAVRRILPLSPSRVPNVARPPPSRRLESAAGDDQSRFVIYATPARPTNEHPHYAAAGFHKSALALAAHLPPKPRRRPSKINFLGRSDNLHDEIYENLLARENRSLASSTGLTYGSAR